MTHHDDPRVADWLADGPNRGPAAALDTAFAKVRATSQRPAWLVGLTGGTIAERPTVVLLRFGILALGVVLLAGLLVGALAAGGMLPLRLPPGPVPSMPAIDANATTAPPATPSPETPSETPSTGLVAYTVVGCVPGPSGDAVDRCTSTAWLAASDGSNARVLPGGGGEVLGWSADGSRLLVDGSTALLVTDAAGAELARFPIWCTGTNLSCADTQNVLCPYPCAGAEGFALSPDGTRVAFVRSYPDVDNATVVAILDVGGGRVTELASTRTTNPPTEERCYELRTCQGDDDTPRWSPDGRRIVFARQVMSPEKGATWTSAALWVVDADGGNLRRVTPKGLYAIDPSWSADGTKLAFTNISFVVNTDHTSVLEMNPDIYTIGADGTNLTQLTDDGISSRPGWTADGRLAFMRPIGSEDASGGARGYENWIMDADGGNQARPGGSLAELTAAGCTACMYPLADAASNGQVYRAYWQPTP